MWISADICTTDERFLYWRRRNLVHTAGRKATRLHPQREPHTVGVPRMARSSGGKPKAFFRTNPSGAFDQYLQDIQKLPLIKDPLEERRLARRVQRGDEKAAERLVTANLRFVISYVKKYQGHGLDL